MKPKAKEKVDYFELADWVIAEAKKAGAEDSRVKIWKLRMVSIRYRGGKPELVSEATTRGLFLEIFVDRRCAGQTTPDFRKETLKGFIQDAVDNARRVEEDPLRTLPDRKYWPPKPHCGLTLADPMHAEFSLPERHALATEIEAESLKTGGQRVISAESGEYDNTSEEWIKTSRGFKAHERNTLFGAGGMMTLRDEGERKPMGWHSVSSPFRSGLPSAREVGRGVAQRALDLMGSRKIPTETLPVVLENRCAQRLLYGFLNAMSGGNVQQKKSFLAGRLGKKVGSNVFTLLDDPFVPGGLGSRNYDQDGLVAKRRTMVERGVLKDYFVDWYYSRKLKREPTTSWPSNLILPPGKRSLPEILKGLPRCLVVTDFIAGNSNSTTGDFSIGVIGKLYEKGKLAHAVAEMNLADNHLKFWGKLAEAANDPWPYSSLRLPSLVFKDVVVSGV
jgi:PmbA protein